MNILLVQTGFLGDVILSTPVIANIKKLYPNSRLSFLTTPLAVPLVKYNPMIDNIIVFDKRHKDSGVCGLWRMINNLKKQKFDKVFSLHKSYRTSFLLAFSGIKDRYGFSRASASLLYTKTEKREDMSHEVLRNLAILRCVGLEPKDAITELQIVIPDEVRADANALISKFRRGLSGLVSIAPGSVWETKRWTVEGFSKVASDLYDRGFDIVIIGGQSDSDLAEKVIKLSGKPLINLCGQGSLLLSAAMISESKLLICNDSAPLHIASAVKTPVVALFCATVEEFGFGPWQVKSKVLGVEGLSCRPCASHGSKYCPTGTNYCMKNLLPVTVLSAALSLIEERNK